MNLKEIRNQLERRKGERDKIIKDIEALDKQLIEAKKRSKIIEKSRFIIQAVAKQTQQELEFNITEPVNFGLATVFDENAYQLKMRFNIVAERPEIRLFFQRGKLQANPMDATGYGQVDVAAYGLKISLHGLHNPPLRPLMLLDEPFKNPDKKARPAIGELMRTLSHRKGIQHIIVTHDPAFIKAADRILHLRIRGETSILTIETPDDLDL